MDINDQFSIKNLLFTKAVPNYVIPVSTNGHKVYGCTDCGDKFILQSSYEYHVNRKSVKITYFCRHCNAIKIFYNRCNLLSHIRSHAFKTATINVGDLRLDPLPLKFFPKKKVSAPISLISTNNQPIAIQPKPTDQQTKTVERQPTTTIQQPSPTIQQLQATNQLPQPTTTTQEQLWQNNRNENDILTCLECNIELTSDETMTDDEKRAKHYMQFTNETYTCPFCFFTLPTACALSTHLRFHLKIGPYLCPECGKLINKTNYPFDHNCEGFRMMRATVRIKCPAPSCHLLHPNDYKDHIKKNHLKNVYKCPYCYVACFDELLMNRHMKNHPQEFPVLNNKSVAFYQCELCPGKLILKKQTETHFKAHSPRNYVFPCWVCNNVFNDILTLATHHLNDHDTQNSKIGNCIKELLNLQKRTAKIKVYRVVKRCDQCKRSFSYKCKFEEITMLPNECPYKCTVPSEPGSNQLLTCHMCQNKMPQNWEQIKKHFSEYHTAHRCVDIKVVLPKINVDKYLSPKGSRTPKPPIKNIISRKPRKKRVRKNEVNNTNDKPSDMPNIIGEFACKVCRHEYDNKEVLEKHLLTHRDPFMAYQCMECGQSFVVKPTFSKHLLLVHQISDFENYIIQKQCYNENALLKYHNNPEISEPLRDNQCKICREQFETPDDLEKHFRVHGMAFLMKNNSNKAISP